MIFQNTPLDEEVRYDHEECNDKRGRLYVKRTRTGWIWNCFNCGEKGFRAADARSYLGLCGDAMPESGRYADRGILCGRQDVSRARLPGDYSGNLPERERCYLERYITKDEIQKYHIGWSRQYGRIILPIYSENQTLLGWQARSLDSEPKYITMKGENAKDNLLFDTGVSGTPNLCLVEDILSAITCGRVLRAFALLGSPKQLQAGTISRIQEARDEEGLAKVRVWLDADKRKESLTYCRQIAQLLSIQAIPVFSEMDPKCYKDGQLKSLLTTA